MKSLLCLLLLATFGLALGVAELAHAAAPPRADDDRENIVYLGHKGPVLVRLHVRLDGLPHRTKYARLIDELFRFADTNRDGVLSLIEAKRLPPVNVLANGAFFALNIGTRSPGATTKMTRAEVAAHYRNAGLRAFQLSFQARGDNPFFAARNQTSASPDQLNARLFALLDTDGDGKLSIKELEAAPDILGKLDVDEDELITTEEFLGRGGSTTSDQEGYVFGGMATDNSPVEKPVHQVIDSVDRELAKRFLKTYGKKGAKSLTARELGVSEEVFSRLDTNRDGKLDADELARFAMVALPDIEVTVRPMESKPPEPKGMMAPPAKSRVEEVKQKVTSTLSNLFTPRKKTGRPAIELHPSSRPLPEGVKVVKEGEGLKIALGSTTLSLKPGSAGGNPFLGFNANEQFKMLFAMADTDGNKYLDAKEAQSNIFFRGTFEAMDGDGDGKLYEKEMLAYLDKMESLRQLASKCTLTLSVTDTGESLFSKANTSKSSTLSVRELRRMSKSLMKLDLNNDGFLSQSEIPRQYNGSFDLGPTAGSGAGFAAVGFSLTQSMSAPTTPRGPVWFRKMDRNRDGDVSRKEWLGTEEEFRLVDTDNDGLISLEEAEAYDRTKRSKK